jgi:uncharacterized surface protein with fasciclin (FAS1) repeats
MNLHEKICLTIIIAIFLTLAFSIVILTEPSGSIYAQSTSCPINSTQGSCRMNPTPVSENNLWDIIRYNNRNSILTIAVDNAGLAGALRSEGPFTIFAPTNEAFNRYPQGTVNSLLSADNKDSLKNILMSHIVQGRAITPQELRSMDSVVTANCQCVNVRNKDGDMYIGTARIIGTSSIGANGIIYYVDNLLIPGCSDVNAMNNIIIRPMGVENQNNQK